MSPVASQGHINVRDGVASAAAATNTSLLVGLLVVAILAILLTIVATIYARKYLFETRKLNRAVSAFRRNPAAILRHRKASRKEGSGFVPLLQPQVEHTINVDVEEDGGVVWEASRLYQGATQIKEVGIDSVTQPLLSSATDAQDKPFTVAPPLTAHTQHSFTELPPLLHPLEIPPTATRQPARASTANLTPGTVHTLDSASSEFSNIHDFLFKEAQFPDVPPLPDHIQFEPINRNRSRNIKSALKTKRNATLPQLPSMSEHETAIIRQEMPNRTWLDLPESVTESVMAWWDTPRDSISSHVGTPPRETAFQEPLASAQFHTIPAATLPSSTPLISARRPSWHASITKVITSKIGLTSRPPSGLNDQETHPSLPNRVAKPPRRPPQYPPPAVSLPQLPMPTQALPQSLAHPSIDPSPSISSSSSPPISGPPKPPQQYSMNGRAKAQGPRPRPSSSSGSEREPSIASIGSVGTVVRQLPQPKLPPPQPESHPRDGSASSAPSHRPFRPLPKI